MKKTLAFLLALIMLCLAAAPAGFAANEDEETLQAKFRDGGTVSGKDYVYYSPLTGAVDTTRYPLTVFLHGEDVGATPRSQITKNGFANYASTAYQSRFRGGGGSFLLAPRIDSGKWPADEAASIKQCIDQFVTQYSINIDTKRIYLIGYSRGADLLWELVKAYPDYFAALIPAAALLQPAAETTAKLKNTGVWLFASENDTNLTARTVYAREVFKSLQNTTYDLSSLRLTSFSAAILPNGQFSQGDTAVLSPDTHCIWYAVTHDMHMFDGSVYSYQTTVDGLGNFHDFSQNVGVIDWLSQQTLEGAKSYDVPDEVRVPFRLFAFIAAFFTQLFAKLFGLRSIFDDG